MLLIRYFTHSPSTLRYLFIVFSFTGLNLFGQSVLTGIVKGNDDTVLPGAALVVVKSNSYTTTDAEGKFELKVEPGQQVEVSFLGYTTYTFTYQNQTFLEIVLQQAPTLLEEVVVTGYGEQTRKDLTGSIGTVKEKDFNKGNYTAPDQLIQGRIAGVQITNSSGQPGVAATIKIRGNSVLTGTGQPLFVVDGVPLSGTSARPNTNNEFDFGTSPSANPLNFLNPSEIASIDVLKDASAAAIYGSRAAYGVVLITTKKGQTGDPKIDFNFSSGVSSIQKKIQVLNTSQFREAISYYSVDPNNDKGGYSDGLGSILRTGKLQNYVVGISGGNTFGKYRISVGYYDQEGIIEKSDLKKFSGSLTANLKFLENKRLGLDVSMIGNQYQESLPPIRNEGGVIGAALVWNPTDSIRYADGSFERKNGVQNPLYISESYNDNSKLSTVLVNLAPYYELTDWLSLKTLFSVNYSTGIRRNSIQQDTIQNTQGSANVYNTESYSSQATSTLTFHKDITQSLNLTAVAGYEYQRFLNKGTYIGVTGPSDSNNPKSGFGFFGLDYTNYIQYSNPGTRIVSSYSDPEVELQSYFARTSFSYKKRYLLTGTYRVDGSSKFGENNKYGSFPSFSLAWIISDEGFFNSNVFDFLKVRSGWGKTGNQEFPAGSATALYGFSNNGGIGQINNPNPDLKWQSDEQANVGVDFSVLHHRISGTLDFFNKITTDLLYPSAPIQPAPPGTVVRWMNLDGRIRNAGLETTINASIINQPEVTWDLSVNATFLKNSVSNLSAPIQTGYLAGGGMSGVTVQEIRNGSPINSFYTRKYLGLDPATGFAIYEDNGNTFYQVGNPNPTKLLGINSSLRFKKFTLTINSYGAFGHDIYNNTLNSNLNVSNIGVGQNIALDIYKNPVKESLANPVAPSSRFIERGDYFKISNATLNYNLGNIGKSFKQGRIYVTGQNLFTLTKYSGFSPEVNIDHGVNGVPSLGIDWQAYPSARTVILGISFTL